MPNTLRLPPARPRLSRAVRTALVSTLAILLVRVDAHAQAAEVPLAVPVDQAATTRHAVSLQLTGSNFDSGASLGYRTRFRGGAQLGIEARALAAREAYVDGFAATGGYSVGGLAIGMLPMVQAGPLDLHLRASVGGRSLKVDETTGPRERSFTLVSEVGPVVNVRVSQDLTLRTGWLAITNFQLSPRFDSEALGQVLLAGAVMPLTPDLQLHADVETGGLFGFDGDGGKYVLRGSVGARWVLGGSARSWLSF